MGLSRDRLHLCLHCHSHQQCHAYCFWWSRLCVLSDLFWHVFCRDVCDRHNAHTKPRKYTRKIHHTSNTSWECRVIPRVGADDQLFVGSEHSVMCVLPCDWYACFLSLYFLSPFAFLFVCLLMMFFFWGGGLFSVLCLCQFMHQRNYSLPFSQYYIVLAFLFVYLR